MAKAELRKPIDALLTEKSKTDAQLTTINDKYNRYSQDLQRLRHEQAGYREAKEHLSNSASSKPARRVFDNNISEAQLKIEAVLKELDQVEKERVVAQSYAVSISKSIKELQNA